MSPFQLPGTQALINTGLGVLGVKAAADLAAERAAADARNALEAQQQAEQDAADAQHDKRLQDANDAQKARDDAFDKAQQCPVKAATQEPTPLPANPLLPKSTRLGMIFQKLGQEPPAGSAMQAMGQMNQTLNAVEDQFSGAPNNPANWKTDGRMYPVQPDNITLNPDGSITATSRGNITTYGTNGSITVTNRATGAVVFQKAGT